MMGRALSFDLDGEVTVGEADPLPQPQLAIDDAKRVQLIGLVQTVKDDIKFGNLTFGSSARDAGIRRIARGLLYLLKGDLNDD
jgi:hypothetical protein